MYKITPKKLFIDIRCHFDPNHVFLSDIETWEKLFEEAGYSHEREIKSKYSPPNLLVKIGKTNYVFDYMPETRLAIGWQHLTENKKPEIERFFEDLRASIEKEKFIQFKYFYFTTVVNFKANSVGKDISGYFYDGLHDIKLDSIIGTIKKSLTSSIETIK